LGAYVAPALAVDELLGFEPEDVGWLFDQPVLPEFGDVLRPEPLDVKAVAGDKMLEPLDRLRRTDQPAGAPPRRHALLAHRQRIADRAMLGEPVGLGVRRPPLEDDADNLRDYVTSALHRDGVADPHILARDLVLVVQCCALHDDTADRDRL